MKAVSLRLVACGFVLVCAAALTACEGRGGFGGVDDIAPKSGLAFAAMPLADVVATAESAEVAGVPVPAAATVVRGLQHSCALKPDATVVCWGNNFFGQLGDNTRTEKLAPNHVAGLADIKALASGDFHTCALKRDGSTLCWGYNSSGQLGDNNTTEKLVPTPVPGVGGATQLALGKYHSCALAANGTPMCWGNNSFGQLGDNTQADKLVPTAIADVVGAVSLTVGDNYTCARRVNRAMRCWGADRPST